MENGAVLIIVFVAGVVVGVWIMSLVRINVEH
jgi:hypothetical protein